jgi:hypothetical protein
MKKKADAVSIATNRCGSDWLSANTQCGNSCQDANGVATGSCPAGQMCQGGLAVSPCQAVNYADLGDGYCRDSNGNKVTGYYQTEHN